MSSSGSGDSSEYDPTLDPLWIRQTNASNRFNETLYIIAPVCFVIFSSLILLLRKNELIRARLPYVIIIEGGMTYALCMWVMMINIQVVPTLDVSGTNWATLSEFSLGWKCVSYNAFNYAIHTAPWFIILARMVLFIKTAQANTIDTSNDVWFDRVVNFIGSVSAPRDFARAKLRLYLLKQQHTQTPLAFSGTNRDMSSRGLLRSSPSVKSSKGSVKDDDNLSVKYVNADIGRITLQHVKEIVLWFLKVAIFFAVSMLWIVFLTSLTARNRVAFNHTIYDSTQAVDFSDPVALCGYAVASTMQSSFYIIWNVGQTALALWAKKKLVSDSYGMLTELVYLQMFYSVMYIIFQILGLWSDEYQATADPRIAYTALTPKSSFYLQWLFYIIHGSTTFLYPLFLVARKKYVMRRFSDKTFKSRADVETLWTKPDGKALIADITRKAFALENSLFLYDTDVPNTSIKHFTHLWDRYLSQDSAFQLNLPSGICLEYHKALTAADQAFLQTQTKKIRNLIFTSILDNYQSEIVRELQSHKN